MDGIQKLLRSNVDSRCVSFSFWKHFQVNQPLILRAGDCERALFSPCSHLSSVMVQNSHTCEGDMMKENNIRTSEANRKTS